LNEDLIDMIIQNRTEGPLTADTIKYGFPNILAAAEEDVMRDN
jgi:hypothetical protein